MFHLPEDGRSSGRNMLEVIELKTISLPWVLSVTLLYYNLLCRNKSVIEILTYDCNNEAKIEPKVGSKNVIRHLSHTFAFQPNANHRDDHRCLRIFWTTSLLENFPLIQRVSKSMTRFQIIIPNNENVLQLQNKLQTIK